MSKFKLLNTEDYWAIWIGLGLLAIAVFIFFLNPPAGLADDAKLQAQLEAESRKAPFKTLAWYEAFDKQQQIKASNEPIGKFFSMLFSNPGTWKSNPLESLITSEAKVNSIVEATSADFQKAAGTERLKRDKAQLAEQLAAELDFKGAALNNAAEIAIEEWRTSLNQVNKLSKKMKTKPVNQIPYLLGLFAVLCLIFGLGKMVMGTSLGKFIPGFVLVFLIGVLSHIIAGQADLKAMGLGFALWAIVLGLIFSNTVGIPTWLQPALATEFYIKTGLVMLGSEILMGKILAIGLPGLFVAWVVTPIVLVVTFWFGQKVLKMTSKSLNITISADMSVCGVSAAVATAAASKATKEELTLAIGLSMVFTSIMMVVMPIFINWLGMPEILGGAWIGGTIDATGAVVAAGAFLGEKALSVAATVKMIQNILIGVIAFGVAIYFSSNAGDNEKGKNKIGWGEIWKRFPKFILGFIGVSILFSLLYEALGPGKAYAVLDNGVIGAFEKDLREWMFCMAFVSIGLSTNFKELKQHFSGGKPLILYLCGQLFNLGLTLLMAYLMFYVVFPEITATI